MSRCKSCGAEIVWIRMKTGKAMPCDKPQVMFRGKRNGRERVVTDDGEVIACEIVDSAGAATGIGRVPHWATCPGASQHRRSHGEK